MTGKAKTGSSTMAISSPEQITAIQIESVVKRFKETTAADSLNLKIHQGEFAALLGPNGAGKTTLVEMIEGIQFPDSGRIQIYGMNWFSHRKELRELLGFSLQETKFLEKLTVKETICLFGSFYSKSKEESIAALHPAGLYEKRDTYVESLSGGQRQKLALCTAILHNPKILILDEPTTGLDPGARREIWNVLLRLKTAGTTMILTTHYMEEAETLCDRILFIDRGKIIADGTLPELLKKNDHSEHILIRLNRPGKNIEWEKITGFRSIRWKEEFLEAEIAADHSSVFLQKLLDILKKKKISFEKLETRKATLDDLFMSMTGRRLEG